MFGSLGWGEILVLAVLGLVIFGPDRLPSVLRDARNSLRHLAGIARSAKADLKAELGPEMADLDLASLHPRRIVQDALFAGDDDDAAADIAEPGVGDGAESAPVAVGGGRFAAVVPLEPGERPPYDADAT